VNGSYKLSENAEANLTEIYAYGLRKWGEAAAEQYYYALIERFEQIADYPHGYPPVDFIRPGYRRSICGVDSIYYRIEGGRVEIMAVLGRQNTDTAL
jgi:toxin ParE1/3/4